MRLFTAIEIDNEARDAIAVEQVRLATSLGPGWRFVKPEHLHLTLVFVGEVDAVRGRQLVDALHLDIAQAPFRVVLGGVGLFPPRGMPRVLWLGALDGAAGLKSLHARVAERVDDADAEGRAFEPHLTLARSRGGGVRRLVQQEAARAIAAIQVEAVALMESRLSPAGPAYTRLAEARLTGP